MFPPGNEFCDGGRRTLFADGHEDCAADGETASRSALICLYKSSILSRGVQLVLPERRACRGGIGGNGLSRLRLVVLAGRAMESNIADGESG